MEATCPRRTPYPLGRQCRYVYDVVCTALPNIPTLGVAIDVIKQVLIPLRLMFCAGWVHHDINPDNILAYRPSDDAPWSVRLSDLKFATKFPAAEIPPKDEIIIGTPGFIACEVQQQQHISPPITIDDDVPCEEYLRRFEEAREKLDLSGPVLQTYQHEFESIWWVLMWETTYRVADRPDTKENIFLRLANPDTGVCVSPYNGVPVASTLEGFIVALDKLAWALWKATYRRNEGGLRRQVAAYADVVGSKHWKAFWGAVEESREQWGEELLMVDSLVWDRARSVAKELGSRVYEFVPLTVQEMQKVKIDAEESKAKKPATKKKGFATKQKGSTSKKKAGDATTKKASDAAKKKAGDATKEKAGDATKKTKSKTVTNKETATAASEKKAGNSNNSKKRKALEGADDDRGNADENGDNEDRKRGAKRARVGSK
ncbi:other/FunK1 protein kinase [Coprinopsis cinerea okayama7|uniref:Other/FunK1 protein kinase n=1 Tax=Coprinopsis cinerea (strain Okayama-7 / 130 / ATCC MYA-4618 / FGSC 9003) TaxID=240176 RepID=A8NB53_COPC7|nr:other/FunK1 protein kinase [Coprinopsis cinerea okayama7\|eukprot:XP_001832054.2 other/FunK1 protein kinase [Coprinopsis cinerea okayama7\